MDPFTAISAVTSAVGLGMKLFGGASASSKAQEAYNIESNISGLESQINNQRRTAMELSARRQQMEIFRNSQRLRAQGIQAAVSQGASFGSGMVTGAGQNTSMGLYNSAGVNQNLELGRNIFGLNDQISTQKLALSKVKSDMATDQGLASLGGSLMQSAGTIGDIAGAGWAGYKSLANSSGLSSGFGNDNSYPWLSGGIGSK